ncbi:MAG: HipA domain-containing protein [Micrococcales bacterium]|nr:HipA domain-containing protein [Micrococcales bacterium]
MPDLTTADLVVELYGTQVATLVGSARSFDVVAHRDGLARFGLDSTILSVAAPLAVVPPRIAAARRRNVFAELLPENRMRARMAGDAGVADDDVIGLLRAYGRDVAGALQIWDPDLHGEPKAPGTETLTAAQVAVLLVHVSENPLANRRPGGKTSLAGVHDKLVLVRQGRRWARALDGYPSTHILKPSTTSPTALYDEEYGARLARAVGLAEHETWIDTFAGVPALVVERFDRDDDVPGGRVHQEDFNQALGASGNAKYQRYGHKVSLAKVATVLAGTDPGGASVRRLLMMTTFAAAVGNLDLHAKNLSLLHPLSGPAVLAPAYDVVPLVHQPNDGELAMAVDGEYRHAAVTRAHLVAEGESWGLASSGDIVEATLDAVAAAVATERPHRDAWPDLATDVARFTANLIHGRPAGAA